MLTEDEIESFKEDDQDKRLEARCMLGTIAAVFAIVGIRGSVRRIDFDSQKGSNMAKKAPSPKAPAKPAKPMSGKATSKSGKKSGKC